MSDGRRLYAINKYSEDYYGEMDSEERRFNLQKNNWLKGRYGLTLKAYNDMRIAQNDLCAICKQPETGTHIRNEKPVEIQLAVDHNHETGEIRALLCHKCNKALGLFSDNLAMLEAAVEYLKQHSAGG